MVPAQSNEGVSLTEVTVKVTRDHHRGCNMRTRDRMTLQHTVQPPLNYIFMHQSAEEIKASSKYTTDKL